MLKAAWIFAYGFASAVLIADTLSGERNHSASLQGPVGAKLRFHDI